MKLSTWCNTRRVPRTTAVRMSRAGTISTERRNGRLFVLEDRRRCQRVRNLVGRRFGALVVEADTGKQNSLNEPIWLARCDCGRSVEASGPNLRAGFTKNCGCGRSAPRPKRKSCESVGDLTAGRWKKILLGAARRGLKIPLTQAEAWELFLRQGSRCALTGRAVTIKEAALNYHPHPPRWVHKDVADLLAMVSEERLREIARELAGASRRSSETFAPEPDATTDIPAASASLSSWQPVISA